MLIRIHRVNRHVKHFARVVWGTRVAESSMMGRLRVAPSQRHRRLHRSGNLRRTGPHHKRTIHRGGKSGR